MESVSMSWCYHGTAHDKEREVSRIFDIGHWTFECPMSNIECPANFTFLSWYRNMSKAKDSCLEFSHRFDVCQGHHCSPITINVEWITTYVLPNRFGSCSLRIFMEQTVLFNRMVLYIRSKDSQSWLLIEHISSAVIERIFIVCRILSPIYISSLSLHVSSILHTYQFLEWQSVNFQQTMLLLCTLNGPMSMRWVKLSEAEWRIYASVN